MTPRWCYGNGIAALLVLFCILSVPSRAEAETFDDLWVSPGVKAAWTWGYGFTWGFEVSVVWSPADPLETPYAPGMVFDLDFGDDLFKLRGAFQMVGPFIGFDTGPALVSDRSGTHFGWAATTWLGYYLYPYFTYTWVAGSENQPELGAYLKLPINTDGDFSGSSGDDLFDD